MRDLWEGEWELCRELYVKGGQGRARGPGRNNAKTAKRRGISVKRDRRQQGWLVTLPVESAQMAGWEQVIRSWLPASPLKRRCNLHALPLARPTRKLASNVKGPPKTWLRLESHGRLYNQRAALLAASPTMTSTATTSDAMTSGGGSSRMPPRLHSRSNFTTRAAQDDSHQLQRRWSLSQLSAQDESEPLLAAGARRGRPASASREHSPLGSFSALFARGRAFVTSAPASRAASVAPSSGQQRRRRSSGTDAPAKLGTFAGVFVPTTLENQAGHR